MNSILRYKGPCAGVNEWLQPKKGGGMMLTPQYRAFKEAMQLLFQLQWGGDPPIKYPVDVVLEIVMPGTDADALNKPIFDALQAAGVLADDKLIRNYAVFPSEKQAPAHTCEIKVWICKHQTKEEELAAVRRNGATLREALSPFGENNPGCEMIPPTSRKRRGDNPQKSFVGDNNPGVRDGPQTRRDSLGRAYQIKE